MRERIKMIRENMKSESGFTLIELMAVLAILALIVAIAVPAIGGILGNAQDGAADSTAEMALKAAELQYVNEFAAEGETGNTTTTINELIGGGYLDTEAGEFPIESEAHGEIDADTTITVTNGNASY